MQESASPSGSSPRAAGLVRSEFQGVGEGGEASFKCIEKQADINGKVVRCVMGVLGAAISVQQLLTDTNTWTDLRSRVDLATCSQEKGAAVIQRLAAMARRTYSGIEQTTEFWLANATALRELGLSTRESLDFTEALNNAMVVSGAKGVRAASVQNALSKAMALGKLRPCFRTAGGGARRQRQPTAQSRCGNARASWRGNPTAVERQSHHPHNAVAAGALQSRHTLGMRSARSWRPSLCRRVVQEKRVHLLRCHRRRSHDPVGQGYLSTVPARPGHS